MSGRRKMGLVMERRNRRRFVVRKGKKRRWMEGWTRVW